MFRAAFAAPRYLRFINPPGPLPKGMGFGFILQTMKPINAIIATRGCVNHAVEIILPLQPSLVPVVERAQRIALAAKQLQLDTIVTTNPYGGEFLIVDETGKHAFRFTSVVFEAGHNKHTVLVFVNRTKSLAVRDLVLGDQLFQRTEAALA